MKFEGSEAGGFGVGFGCNDFVFRIAELLDGEMKGSGIDGFEGNGDVDNGWLVGWLPLGLNLLACGGIE